MPQHSFYKIIGYSVLGSLITTFTFAICSSGKIQFSTLRLPAVSEIAFIIGLICGIFLAPLMYWSLKDKHISIILLIIYTLAIINIILLSLFTNGRIPIYGSFIYWTLILIIMKYFGPPAVK